MPAAEEIGQAVVKMLKPLTRDQRKDVIAEIKDVICIHCGEEQPKNDFYDMGCQCWNDE